MREDDRDEFAVEDGLFKQELSSAQRKYILSFAYSTPT